jgi:hypothetical protein
MKSALMIKDLSVSKELDCKALVAVRGGSNSATVVGAGFVGNQNGAVGVGNIIYNEQPQIVTQLDLAVIDGYFNAKG